jgi:hypothetical protein
MVYKDYCIKCVKRIKIGNAQKPIKFERFLRALFVKELKLSYIVRLMYVYHINFVSWVIFLVIKCLWTLSIYQWFVFSRRMFGYIVIVSYLKKQQQFPKYLSLYCTVNPFRPAHQCADVLLCHFLESLVSADYRTKCPVHC